jgi:hypothetical protein
MWNKNAGQKVFIDKLVTGLSCTVTRVQEEVGWSNWKLLYEDIWNVYVRVLKAEISNHVKHIILTQTHTQNTHRAFWKRTRHNSNSNVYQMKSVENDGSTSQRLEVLKQIIRQTLFLIQFSRISMKLRRYLPGKKSPTSATDQPNSLIDREANYNTYRTFFLVKILPKT